MGAGVSNWKLANAVASLGQLGVVSGTALDLIFVRRLQVGDPGGHMVRAASHFPERSIAKRIVERYFVPGGKPESEPFRGIPPYTATPTTEQLELTMLANFCEVFLAKEGHSGPVGLNLLEKIQMPNMPSLYGAMLAGVDYVLMGAGIPWEIPGILDRLAVHEPTRMKLHVEDELPGMEAYMDFQPDRILKGPQVPLRRPKFLAIVSSSTLATALLKRANGRIDGFVVEGPKAGGHNSPPRGPMHLSEEGEPIYGPRDLADPAAFRAMKLPFWLAGTYGRQGRLREALSAGATGIQVGTAFALCAESGLEPELRRRLLSKALKGDARIHSDPVASPTGFPFKVAVLEGTLSEQDEYANRPRVCDAGYLRRIYRCPDGTLGYRCPASPTEVFLAKGGKPEEAEGRKCLCNGLMANIGLPQHQRSGYEERPLVTMGDDLLRVKEFLRPGRNDFTARDVLSVLAEGAF
ncbi:nitronate monooxygenase [bacterium]|nr:nitronate monooxygenase [bacterium]